PPRPRSSSPSSAFRPTASKPSATERSARNAAMGTKPAGRRTVAHTSPPVSKIGSRGRAGLDRLRSASFPLWRSAMRLHSSLFCFLLVPALAPGANREIVELQRDVAALQDQIRVLSTGTNEKLTAITVLLQQTLDAANNANKAVAVLESRVNDRLEKQAAGVTQPVAVLGAKVDQMSGDFVSVRNA